MLQKRASTVCAPLYESRPIAWENASVVPPTAIFQRENLSLALQVISQLFLLVLWVMLLKVCAQLSACALSHLGADGRVLPTWAEDLAVKWRRGTSENMDGQVVQAPVQDANVSALEALLKSEWPGRAQTM